MCKKLKKILDQKELYHKVRKNKNDMRLTKKKIKPD